MLHSQHVFFQNHWVHNLSNILEFGEFGSQTWQAVRWSKSVTSWEVPTKFPLTGATLGGPILFLGGQKARGEAVPVMLTYEKHQSDQGNQMVSQEFGMFFDPKVSIFFSESWCCCGSELTRCFARSCQRFNQLCWLSQGSKHFRTFPPKKRMVDKVKNVDRHIGLEQIFWLGVLNQGRPLFLFRPGGWCCNDIWRLTLTKTSWRDVNWKLLSAHDEGGIFWNRDLQETWQNGRKWSNQ